MITGPVVPLEDKTMEHIFQRQSLISKSCYAKQILIRDRGGRLYVGDLLELRVG